MGVNVAGSGFVGDLRGELAPTSVVDDPDVLSGFAHDRAHGLAVGEPLALARPRTTEEVVACVRLAAAHDVPVVTRGAGSGLSGGANAVAGCLLLSTEAMDRIVEIDRADRLAVVQPGVVTQRLRDAVAEDGLFYPPDPGSVDFCTVGGNVATNAGGMCCVKYGVTADFVLGLEVVLASGEVVRTGRRTVKGVVGYDLTRLFVGSEGTLGIVTEVTLALRPAPAAVATTVATFPRLSDAGRAVELLVERGHRPSMLELLDRTTLRAIDDLTHMGLGDAAAMLVAQDDSPAAARTVGAIEAIYREAGASDVATTTDPREGDALLTARRSAYAALERLGTVLVDDVSVPRSRLAEMLGHVQRLGEESGLTVAVVAHAGDGNLHPNIVYDAGDAAQVRAAHDTFDALLAAALGLGGTVTGEHGVGLLKNAWMARELGPVSMRLHRAIKDSFDPDGLLNPGKAVAAAAYPNQSMGAR